MFEYYLFYKPFNVLCQFSPEGEKMTLAHHLSHLAKDIYPVGRLDFDSEGLLLLTNDKQLNHQLLNPDAKHSKTYWVQVDGLITQEALNELQRGVMINVNGRLHKTKHAVAKILDDDELVVPEREPPIRYRKSIPTSWISLTITEGKNRQVRRMTAAVGYPTLRLIRHSIGNVSIENMLPGEYKMVGAVIKKLLFSI